MIGGKYDPMQFNPAFWRRFHGICVNLGDHGIIMHLLLFPHNGRVRNSNWRQSLFNPDHRILCKYVWKWFMAKNQCINAYQKGLQRPLYPDDYDPRGYSLFEEDALVLRHFWNTLTDYGNLDYVGCVASGLGFRKMVLSSRTEAIAYMASRMGAIGIQYAAYDMSLTGVALADGICTVNIWAPAASSGLVQTLKTNARGGSVTIHLPAFTDNLTVHFYQSTQENTK